MNNSNSIQEEQIKSAEVLCVGTELLIGDIINTDAARISRVLSELGIAQYAQSVIGDNPERLRRAIRSALFRCDLLIVTGGLGPTVDDITTEALASVAGVELRLHEPSLLKIEKFFARAGRPMTENNIKQAMIPEDAEIFPNPVGTAPGMALRIPAARLESEGEQLYCAASGEIRTAILLPGPPHECAAILEESVIPYLRMRSSEKIVSENLRILGLGESEIGSMLGDLMNRSVNPSVAPYCGDGEVRLRITARETDESLCRSAIACKAEEIMRSPVGEYIYSRGAELADVLVSEASAKKLHITCAESCTGGLVAGVITSVPGSSEVFDCGAVTYSNEMKTKLLGVSTDTLTRFGAVSPETASEMALGALELSGADIAVSLTGIAGPGGGTDEKPVGLVYIAVASRAGGDGKLLLLMNSKPEADFEARGARVRVLRCLFPHTRDRVRTFAVKQALASVLSAVRFADSKA